ncbi:nucleoside hydrolase, partial [Escherichia coli]
MLDGDPGHDEASALIMAATHPPRDLIGLTTGAGTQTLDNTLINGLNVCQQL